MPIIEGTQRYKTAEAVYDFAVDGGAQGTITLRPAPGDGMGTLLPTGAVVAGGYVDTTTAPAGTGTVALTLEGAGDLRAAATIASTGRSALLTGAKTTQARAITMTIGTANLTQGVFRVVVFYK